MNLAHDERWPQQPRRVRVASLESLVCALEHENGVGDLEGGSELDAHDLHNVGLGEQQEGLPINHLPTQTHKGEEVVGQGTAFLVLKEVNCWNLRWSSFQRLRAQSVKRFPT